MDPRRGEPVAAAEPVVLEGGVHEDCEFAANDVPVEVVVVRGDTTLRRCAVSGGYNRGLSVERGVVLVEECRFSGSRIGVWASGPCDVVLRGCRFEGLLSVGVIARAGARVTVEGCVFEGLPDGGVVVRPHASGIVRDCRVNVGMTGIQLDGPGEVWGCDVHARVGVIAGAGSVVRECRIERCDSFGLHLLGPARVERCRLAGNHMGIGLYQAGDVRISDCDVTGGHIGVVAMDGSGGIVQGCRIGPHPGGEFLVAAGATTVRT